MRDILKRLTELIEDTLQDWECDVSHETVEEIAEHLIENGVIAPPVALGQTVWCIYNRKKPREFKVKVVSMAKREYSFLIETKDGMHKHYCDKAAVGKWVFFTREEAEKALGGDKNDSK